MTHLLSSRSRNLLLLFVAAIFVAAITACRETAVDDAPAVRLPADVGVNTVEFYSSEFCGCCDYHADAFVEYAEAKDDLTLRLINADNAEIAEMKRAAGVPLEVWGCHTAYMDGYFLEGHVPLSAVEWLLNERPENVRGIATQHADGGIDLTTWLGLTYYVVYDDGEIAGPLPAP